jgi:hypothetical protein
MFDSADASSGEMITATTYASVPMSVTVDVTSGFERADTAVDSFAIPATDPADIIPGVSELLIREFVVDSDYPEPNFSEEELNEIYEYADSGISQKFHVNRELSETESRKIVELSGMFYSGNTKPSTSISKKEESDTVYFDMSLGVFVFPERDMTDDEMLQVVEFVARINYALNKRADFLEPAKEPAMSEISKDKAIRIGIDAAESLFQVDTTEMNVVASYLDKSAPFGSQWLIRIAPYNRDSLLRNNLDFGEYAIFMDSMSGIITSAKMNSSILVGNELSEIEKKAAVNDNGLFNTAIEIVSNGDSRKQH